MRRLRSEQGYSQEGFALRVGLHRTYVGNIERGEKAVTIVTANKLAGDIKRMRAEHADNAFVIVLGEEAARRFQQDMEDCQEQAGMDMPRSRNGSGGGGTSGGGGGA